MTFIAPIVKENVKEDILKTNKRIDSINVVHNTIVHKYDSIATANIKLVKEVDYSEKLLDKYDVLNTIVFSAIGIVLGLIVIVGYFGVFKPAREDLKEVRGELKEAQELQSKIKNDMNELFSEYFKNHKKQVIDDALKNIENNTDEASNKMGQLMTYQYEKFDDVHIQKMIEIIKKKSKFTNGLLQLISRFDNIYTETFFAKSIKDTTFQWTDVLIQYFAKYNKTDYIDDIAKYVIRTYNITPIFYIIRANSLSYLENFLNNDILVNEISDFALMNLGRDALDATPLSAEDREKLESTKTYKKYVEKIVPPPMPETPPEEEL